MFGYMKKHYWVRGFQCMLCGKKKCQTGGYYGRRPMCMDCYHAMHERHTLYDRYCFLCVEDDLKGNPIHPF